ncbi:GtrA family protein [Blastococcus sp. HT6-30]|uniref:GtrA family protein n=1 Tax=Blastococcus sp. HT6-30 TaxID=3144843 RepID=UPI00321B8BA2
MGLVVRLRQLLRAGERRLVRELGAFGVVGAVCFAIDVGLFQLLYAHVGAGAVTSKLLATLVSMSVAFVGHRFWSFAHRARTGLRREYWRFAAVNGAALVVGLGIVAFVRYPLDQQSALVLQGANLVSIALGTVLRFLGYRRWVFPPRTSAAPPDPVPAAAPGGPVGRA